LDKVGALWTSPTEKCVQTGHGKSPSKAIYLYTADGRFVYALNERPSNRMLRRLYEQAGVLYWSIGV
jgi:hypothetical protein